MVWTVRVKEGTQLGRDWRRYTITGRGMSFKVFFPIPLGLCLLSQHQKHHTDFWELGFLVPTLESPGALWGGGTQGGSPN